MKPGTGKLIYSFGNAYGPNGIIGRFSLEINAYGVERVLLEHQQLDNVRMWTATLNPKTEQTIWEALTKSDFPHTPRPAAVVPDSTMCEIAVMHPELFPEETSVSLPFDTIKDLTGYKELLDILHTIIHQIGAGSIQGTEDKLGETVVSDVRLNYTETITGS